MRRFYEHARLVAEVTKTAGGTVQLIGTDTSQLEHDIIQSGWGDAQGYKIGGAEVSTKHAGFVVNNGNATSKDILDLIKYIKEEVYKKFNVNIEPEIQIVGEE